MSLGFLIAFWRVPAFGLTRLLWLINHPKAKLIENSNAEYNEAARQRLLINEARKITNEGVLIALDADEFLGGDWEESAAWSAMKNAPPGTSIKLSWMQLLHGEKKCWSVTFPFGFVDDGRNHSGLWIHNYRVPFSETMPSLVVGDVNVLHYQYIDQPRMRSKQRWYQCAEHLNNAGRSFVGLYRQYHHMDSIAPNRLHDVNPEWFKLYRQKGTMLPQAVTEPYFWWDKEILGLFEKHGAEKFRRLAIWDIDWVLVQTLIHRDGITDRTFRDPRNLLEKLLHLYFKASQKRAKHKIFNWLDRFLEKHGW
jgi:hypothetical protein